MHEADTLLHSVLGQGLLDWASIHNPEWSQPGLPPWETAHLLRPTLTRHAAHSASTGLPQQHTGALPSTEGLQMGLARSTAPRTLGHVPTRRSAAAWHLFPPLPKPNPGHLLKYFCRSFLSWEGLGAEFSYLYSVWHFCSTPHFCVQAISSGSFGESEQGTTEFSF